MLKYLITIHRRPGLSHEEFSRHWREVHGPLVMRTPEVCRHFVGYVQNHVQQPGEWDGVAEVHYPDEHARAAMLAEPLYRSLIVPDEERFQDRSRSRLIAVEATTMLRPGA